MFVRIGKIFLVLALVAMLGAHWMLIQTVAWTSMLAANCCTYSVKEAVAETFDGDHPCPICKAIAAGKQSEKKTELSFQPQRLEFPPVKENFVLMVPATFQLLPLENFTVKSHAPKPLLRPPRSFFV